MKAPRMSQHLSRRQFHLLSVSAAASAAIPSVRRIHAAGPNEKLGIAIIGLNGRGMSHVEGFAKSSNIEIRAVVDIDEAVGEKKASMISGITGKRPTVYRDMRKAFDSKDIDMVSCATPNHWHALSGIWAMQAGASGNVILPMARRSIRRTSDTIRWLALTPNLQAMDCG